MLFAHNSTANMEQTPLLHAALVSYLCKNDVARENLWYGSIEVMDRMVFKMISVFCGCMDLKLNSLGWTLGSSDTLRPLRNGTGTPKLGMNRAKYQLWPCISQCFMPTKNRSEEERGASHIPATGAPPWWA